jgi:protein involved in polysaccharide export with SLBB domain
MGVLLVIRSRECVPFYKLVFVCFLFACLLSAVGCQLKQSTTDEMRRFEAAGPIKPKLDVNLLLNSKKRVGYYRVVPGDILVLDMPAALRVVSSDLTKWYAPASGHDDVEPYQFRVSDAGNISLPIIEKLPVSGLTLKEIELLIVKAYYPKYVINLPSVICKIKEYQTFNITVGGGVVRPGHFKLNSEEMSLVSALMKAGGIIDQGAALIRIQHAAAIPVRKGKALGTPSQPSTSISRTDDVPDGSIPSQIQNLIKRFNEKGASELSLAKKATKHVDLKPIVLPVKSMNIPFADVELLDGDTIEVQKLNPEVFTVLGPVDSPGVFPYPPDVEYSLMQALGFAGGFDLTLSPSYITMYRQDADGKIVTATFRLKGKMLAEGSSIKIKPGDVISVEMTADVRARMIIRDMLDIRIGYDLSDLTD